MVLISPCSRRSRSVLPLSVLPADGLDRELVECASMFTVLSAALVKAVVAEAVAACAQQPLDAYVRSSLASISQAF